MNKFVNPDIIIRDINAVRASSPLVHNITNYVVMNNTANALLAIGASPVMAHAIEEMEEMASIASALVLNIGTLSPKWVEAMVIAGERAKKRKIPIVLDPVGAGATSYRTNTSLELIEKCHPTIIRANASEILALARGAGDNSTKGVDSSADSNEAVECAKVLSLASSAVVVISGQIDYITDGKRVAEVHNGSPMMPMVTGLGCSASALTGAFAAVDSDPFDASISAMAVMGIAGEIAASKSAGNGSLQLNFLDELYNISEKEINAYLK